MEKTDQAAPGQGEAEDKGTSAVSPEAAAHDPLAAAEAVHGEDGGAEPGRLGVLRYDEPVQVSEFDRMLAGARGRMVNVRAHLDHAMRGDARACAHALTALADLVESLFDVAPKARDSRDGNRAP